jgi:hypothetical protein
MYSLEKDGKTLTLVSLFSRQVYKDQLKLKGENEAKEKDQPCKDVRKSKNKMSRERKRLDLAKIGNSGDSAGRREKKREDNKGKMRRIKCGKDKEIC